MELKHQWEEEQKEKTKVLIVPSGIETTMQIINQLSFHVLIVPSGIETPTLGPLFGSFKVLIVPSGIET